MRDLLRGIDAPPVVVGLARGLFEAMILAALAAAAVYFTNADIPDKAIALPIILAVVRTLEGLADHIDPKTTRGNGGSGGE